jgi:serine/threonine protein kinase/tetratricopeptide (TPR) repeat protein
VLFLNARRGGRRVELLCYTSGRTVELADVGGTKSDGDDGPDEPPSALGRCIGEYKLLTELGRGAMGIVYRAWQPSLNREVAIKVQPRTGDAKADARFRREVRALGRVEHPNLIKVHTSGSDGDYFYYTMELVEGAPLAAVSDALTQDGRTTIVDLPAFQEKVGAACAAAKAAEKPLSVLDKSDPFKHDLGAKSRDLVSLPELLIDAQERHGNSQTTGRDFVRQIVTLMRPVAGAADSLHEAGILHRDIKPGNILVTADGSTAVLMDLGLAQLADDIEGRLTRTRQFVGTLRYASPQQVLAAGPLDRRADVYSLGATLWELLALRPLFGATEVTPTMALMEMIQRDDPERLGRINHSVDRDLEAVVHKCLEKSPDRRYATAQDLAADLGRWLDGKPVTARPVRGWERAWKWSKRRPLLSGLSAALVLAVVVGTMASLVFAARAEREAAHARAERDVANEQKRRTRQALDMMVSEDMIDRLSAQKELTKGQRQFLQRALDYYREFAAEAPTDLDGRKLDAEANYRVAYLLQALGQREDAITAYREAARGYESLIADLPAEPEYRKSLALCHKNVGTLLIGIGRLQESEGEYRTGLALVEELAAQDPANLKYRHDIATFHLDLGQSFARLGRVAAAETEYRTALARLEKLSVDDPADPTHRTDLAATHHNLGYLFVETGRRAQAEAEYRAALSTWEKLVIDQPTVATHRRQLGASHNNLSRLYIDLGRNAEAEAEERAAIAVFERLAADLPAVPEYRSNLAWSQNNLGLLLGNFGRWADAEAQYRAALAVRDKLAADFPGVPEYRNELAASHHNLGVLYNETGRAGPAEAEYRAALAVRKNLVAEFPASPDFRRDTATSHANLANVLTGIGSTAAAETEYKAALAIQDKLASEFPTAQQYRSDAALCHNNLAIHFSNTGRRDAAEAEYRTSLDLRQKLASDAPEVLEYAVELGITCLNLGNLFFDGGQSAEALPWHTKAVDRLTPVVEAQPRLVRARLGLRNARVCLAQDLAALNRFDEALAGFDAALKLDDGSFRLLIRVRRADCLNGLGRTAEARREADEAMADPSAPPGIIYYCACTTSQSSAAPGATAAESQAARAVQLLRKAIVKGYADIGQLLADSDLAPLRKRADYAEFLWDLADMPVVSPQG